MTMSLRSLGSARDDMVRGSRRQQYYWIAASLCSSQWRYF